MLYLSLAIIFLGILIFAYSIIVDTKRRREPMPLKPSTRTLSPQRNAAEPLSTPRSSQNTAEKSRISEHTIAEENHEPLHEKVTQHAQQRTTPESMRMTPENVIPSPVHDPSPQLNKAILFEDGSHVIDYNNESGTIDASLEGYKNIKRIGSGYIIVEKGGINFYRGKKLYRYDFHRINDIKTGGRFMALFLAGSDTVKLFILDKGNGVIDGALDAYRDFMKGLA